MKRASDGQLLAAVLAVPVGALLLISGVSALFGEPNAGETIAIGCAMILMLSTLLPQLAGVRFAANGPRSLQNRLGFLGAFFAMMLVGQMPSADQSLARAALAWLPLALVIALVGGRDFARHINVLRRHPRGLRLLAQGWKALVLIFLAIAVYIYWRDAASLAQTIWALLVVFSASLSSSQYSDLHLPRKSGVKILALVLADAICWLCFFMIFLFVARMGAMNDQDVLPLLIGGAIGIFIAYGAMALGQYYGAKQVR